MDIRDICNAGGDILDIVADAINRNDYSGLSDNISKTVSRVVNQVREEAGKGTYGEPVHQYGRTAYTRKGQAGYRSIYEKNNRYTDIYSQPDSRQGPDRPAAADNRPLPAVVTAKPAGRISGPVQLAWGILATGGFGITALVMAIMMAVSGGMVFTILAAVFGGLTLLGITDIVRGSRKIRLVKRFRHYAKLIGTRSYIAIGELASHTACSQQEVVRDLKKMLKKHMFLQGRLDQQQTTFILTSEAWQQYLQAEQERRNREKEQAEQRQARSDARQAQQTGSRDRETERILKEGNAYIRMVSECNQKIHNREMSGKLYRLEKIMRRIFEHVERHPESAEDLHKFMEYYLPTTSKLLHAYIDLDQQDISGGHISATKREIEDTLDIINEAFENLLDSMFEDTAWDISSDISVMKTMMAGEGLTGEKDFHVNLKKEKESCP